MLSILVKECVISCICISKQKENIIEHNNAQVSCVYTNDPVVDHCVT